MRAENELRLEVAAGMARGFSIAVDERLVIGRNSEDPGRLAGDPELSRHHAEIRRAPSGEFTIKDLSSTNGTFVNGTRLNAPAVLSVGDEIELGTTKLIVRSAPVAAAPVRPDVDVRAATVTAGVLETISDPAAAAAPAPAEPDASTGGSPLKVRLTVDFDGEAAQLSFHGAGEPIELVLEGDGCWRVNDRGR